MSDVLGGEPDEDQEDRENVVSIGDRARAGEAERDPEDAVPAEPPVDGDHQLTLNLGTVSKAKKVEEATISLGAAERPINGLLDVDTEYELLVRVKPRLYESVPIRKDGVTRAWKQRQPVNVLAVRRAFAEEELGDLVRRALQADATEAQVEELLLELGQAVRDRRAERAAS